MANTKLPFGIARITDLKGMDFGVHLRHVSYHDASTADERVHEAVSVLLQAFKDGDSCFLVM